MNYGHGVLIGFMLFAVFILHFVVRSFNERIELVSEDYYAQELTFQSRIEASRNATPYDSSIVVKVCDNSVCIDLPVNELRGISDAEAFFFRPSDDRLDVRIPILPVDSGSIRVPLEKLVEGRYEVQISWTSDGTSYYAKRDLHL